MGSLSSMHSSKMEKPHTSVHERSPQLRCSSSSALLSCALPQRQAKIIESFTDSKSPLWPTNLHRILLSHPPPCINPHSHSQRQEEQKKKHANPQATDSHCFAGFLHSGERGLHHIPIHSNTFQYISEHNIAFHRSVVLEDWLFSEEVEWEWILDLRGRVEAIEEAACRGWLRRPPSPWQPPLHAACKLCHSSLLEVRIAMPQ